jgi:hypothetical protein
MESQSTVQSRLSDIPFYPTCRVGTLHFINSHSEGFNSIETARTYVDQKREATATDVLLFRRWCDLAGKKRKDTQKQIPTTNFFIKKKKKIPFTNLHNVKYYFCLWDFFIWCRAVFSSKFNNIVNWVDIYPRLFHYSSVFSEIFDYPTVLRSRLGRIIGTVLYI